MSKKTRTSDDDEPLSAAAAVGRKGRETKRRSTRSTEAEEKSSLHCVKCEDTIVRYWNACWDPVMQGEEARQPNVAKVVDYWGTRIIATAKEADYAPYATLLGY